MNERRRRSRTQPERISLVLLRRPPRYPRSRSAGTLLDVQPGIAEEAEGLVVVDDVPREPVAIYRCRPEGFAPRRIAEEIVAEGPEGVLDRGRRVRGLL